MLKWTIRHHYAFERGIFEGSSKELGAKQWDTLRTSPQASQFAPAFYLPSDAEAWRALCRADASAAASAEAIAAIVRRLGVRRLTSVGVGRACVEYHLVKAAPGLRVSCTEAAPGVLERLAAVFPEAEAFETLDLRHLQPPKGGWGELVLLHRLDTELDDTLWRKVYAELAAQTSGWVLVVATGFLTPKTFLQEARQRLLGLRGGRSLMAAGYLRTRARYRDLWRPSFCELERIHMGNLEGFLLRRP